MVHEYKAPKPVQKGKSNPDFAERLNRTIRAFRAAGFSYSPDDYITRRTNEVERESQIFAAEFGESCVRNRLVSISRIALPQPNMFEFEDGSLDKTNKVKSALFVRVQCSILNEEALRKDGLELLIDHRAAQCMFKLGRIITPVSSPVYKDGKLVAYKISAFNNVYYIPDTANGIREITSKYGKPTKSLTVAVANPIGPVYQGEAVYTVHSDEDFIASDVSPKDRGQNILDLIGANKHGFLSPGETNGVARYLEAQNRLSKKGLTSKEIDELDIESLRTMLATKKKSKMTAK